MPLFVDNVDQGKNGYGIALWNIEPRTVANTIGVAGDTTGFYANDTFLTLNGPTAQLDDAYNGVTLEFTSGKLEGFQTRIKTYFANSSLIVDSLPNMPANNDGYRLLFQTKDVKSICAQNNSTLSISTKYQVSNVYGKVSNTILGHTYRDSVLFKQSQTPQFLYETPYQLKSLRTQGGTVKTSYKSRRRELVTIVPQAGTAGSMTVDSGIQFTFPFFDGTMSAKEARENFQVFVAATSDNINTPVGNSLAISGQLDSVNLGGGGAGGGREVPLQPGDQGGVQRQAHLRHAAPQSGADAGARLGSPGGQHQHAEAGLRPGRAELGRGADADQERVPTHRPRHHRLQPRLGAQQQAADLGSGYVQQGREEQSIRSVCCNNIKESCEEG